LAAQVTDGFIHRHFRAQARESRTHQAARLVLLVGEQRRNLAARGVVQHGQQMLALVLWRQLHHIGGVVGRQQAHPDPPLSLGQGATVVGLAVLARLATRWGFSAIPLYLLAGLAFGNGGLLPLGLSAGFAHIGAEIGVLLLLFMLGLEYTGQELRDNLRVGL